MTTSPYGIDNLPYCVFVPAAGAPRVGVRYGDEIVDLARLLDDSTFMADSLNPFLEQGPQRWAEVRTAIQVALREERNVGLTVPVAGAELLLPFTVGDYVDFYASEHHATNLGRLFRPDAEPLLPNWKHLPVSYHGRGGTVIVSGEPVARPWGQSRRPGQELPEYGPSRRLDIEVELGFVVGAATTRGHSVSPDAFSEHVFGVVATNDWSARDLQAWEYVPLGPHLGKSFATSVSAWVTPLAALEGARRSLPGQDPAPLPHLLGAQDWALDVDFEVFLNGVSVSRPRYRDMYWSPAQMLAHMTSNGASVRPGDFFASGTVSGPSPDQFGSFIELTWNGERPIALEDGTSRSFLADGDVVTITATARTPHGDVAMGDVTAVITANPQHGS